MTLTNSNIRQAAANSIKLLETIVYPKVPMPPIEMRCEWRKQQTLVRQNAIPNNTPPTEFKVGTWGGGTKAKRTIMEAYRTSSKYIMSTYNANALNCESATRKRDVAQIQYGDILHMKDAKNHYKGVVTSRVTGITREELFRSFPDVVIAAWNGLPDDRDHNFKAFDVRWIKQPLSDDMKIRLNKLTTRGGGCTKQCGTIIKLA
jgi:hypothetical protein